MGHADPRDSRDLRGAVVVSGRHVGRYFAIVIGALVAIDALLEIPAYPFWSLGMFGLSLWIIHGLTSAGEYEDRWGEAGASAGSTAAPLGPRPPM